MSFKSKANAVLEHVRYYAKAYITLVPVIGADFLLVQPLILSFAHGDAIAATANTVITALTNLTPVIVAFTTNTTPEKLQEYQGAKGIEALGVSAQEFVDAFVKAGQELHVDGFVLPGTERDGADPEPEESVDGRVG